MCWYTRYGAIWPEHGIRADLKNIAQQPKGSYPPSWVILANKAKKNQTHYNDVIMGAIASQITSLTIVYSTVYSGADQRKIQSSVSLAFVRGIHRWPVNSPHKPVTRKMFPFDDVIIYEHHPLVTRRASAGFVSNSPYINARNNVVCCIFYNVRMRKSLLWHLLCTRIL